VENVLKVALKAHGLDLPTGESWHRDLVTQATAAGIITTETATLPRSYLAFRHFFSHGYAVDLRADLIEPLARDVKRVWLLFERDIAANPP
jgi:hypothetical protein